MYCRKCGTQIPDDSRFCLKCGEKIVIGNNEENESSFSKITKMILAFIKGLISLEWVETVCDYVCQIPLIGPLLSGLAYLLLTIIVVCVVLTVYLGIAILLSNMHPIACAIYVLSTMVGLAYYGSYRGGGRKKWFFWVTVVLSLIVITIMIIALF